MAATRTRIKVATFFLITLVSLIFFEALLSTLLIYRYRHVGVLKDGSSLLSTIVGFEKLFVRLKIIKPRIPFVQYELSLGEFPKKFYRYDDYLGYRANAGPFTHIYKRRRGSDPWEALQVKVTINPDGSRWTGESLTSPRSHIYVFGDSFVFGDGVHDEHTFSYLLQMARRDRHVDLFALSGYGLSQAYRRFQLLRDKITKDDSIVIGYADYYGERNVVAPSRLRFVEEWYGARGVGVPIFSAPKAELSSEGIISFTLVDQDCQKNGNYCAQPDPSPEYVSKVSAALINGIADNTQAEVYLLWIAGPDNDPVFTKLSKKVRVIRARPQDFPTFVQDNIENFDPHPGPYWHHAIARKLIEMLKQS